MSKTSIPSAAQRKLIVPTATLPEPPKKETHRSPLDLVKVLASLRLTVWLFALSILLILFGTLAQADQGLATVLSHYFRSGLAWIPLQIFVKFGQIFLGIPPSVHMSGSFPFPSGWAIGTALLVNLVAAHLVRFQLTLRRSGVLVLHTGLLFMMAGELITGVFSVESRMTLAENQTLNYAEDIRACELAIIDTSDPKDDHVVVVPASMLAEGGLIKHPALPFDIQVQKYMVNSAIARKEEAPADVSNPATAGDGLRFIALDRAEVNGTKSEVDLPAAYVSLRNKETGNDLGTYMVSTYVSALNQPAQTVSVDGKKFDMSLRFKRNYKPYTMKLLEFRFDRYPGTDIPRNFSSLVRLVDPETKEDRQVLIRMNEPLDYRGDTYYQADWDKNTEKGTVLQVVHNPGSQLPYYACIMICLGMVIHFSILLVKFLKNRSIGTSGYQVPGLLRFLPVPLVGAVVLSFIIAAMADDKKAGSWNLEGFGNIPVMENGRVKPLDTVARNSLMMISSRQTYTDEKDQRQSAIRWLLEVMASNIRQSEVSKHRLAYHIDHPKLLKLLALAEKPGSMYSLAEIAPKSKELVEEAVRLKDDKEPTDIEYAKSLEELTRQILDHARFAPFETPQPIFRIENDQVLDLLGLERREGLRYAFDEIVPRMYFLKQEIERLQDIPDAQQTIYGAKVLELAKKIQLYVRLASLDGKALEIVPPATEKEQWKSLEQVVEASQASGEMNQYVAKFESILRGYGESKKDLFNQGVADYQKLMATARPGDANKSSFETFFNRFAPFYQCSLVYGLTFALACISWVVLRQPLNRACFWIAVVTLIVHSFALIARMCIQGRPPVTNLYSSAVFIGWGAVGLALLLEVIFRSGVGTLLAGLLGSLSMLVAHHLGGSGETIEVMQAVLDTNFWLATHVTAVTLGYTATFVAGFLGLMFILFGTLTRLLNASMMKSLSQMIYGILCFAMLMSFTGTVLGGIWADYSWGRFWGWDPKENGALIIVVWNALILHARWAGMVKQRGIAILSIVGNMVTGWSWFGTNQLGVGLHAYGFNNTLAFGLTVFWGTQLLIIALALLPRRMWRSFAT